MIRPRQASIRRPVFAFLFAALLLTVCGRDFGQSAGQGTRETVPLAEYVARLEAAEQSILAAEGAAASEAVRQAAEDLWQVSSVLLPDNRRVDISPLFTMDEAPSVALQRLAVVRGQLELAQEDNAAERFASLDAVLASDALNPERGLLDWLRRLLESDWGSGDAPDLAIDRGMQTVLTVVGGLVAVVVLGLILQAVLGTFVSQAELRARQGTDGEPMTSAAARRAGLDLAQVGSYRDAVRQLYLATLLTLEERGLLRGDRSLTNREVLAQVGGATIGEARRVQGALRPVVDTFESVWYGLREPDAAGFESYARSVDVAVDAIHAAEKPAARTSDAEADSDG